MRWIQSGKSKYIEPATDIPGATEDNIPKKTTYARTPTTKDSNIRGEKENNLRSNGYFGPQ
jgi:hypothetical protein